MKKILILLAVVIYLHPLNIYPKINNSFESCDTFIKNNQDTSINKTDLRKLIPAVLKEVNDRSRILDLIHSEGEIYVKSATIDQKGSIEIKAKKPNDFWFRIWGSFAIISKDAFIAHFNRKNFLYFDNLNDKAIEGPSTDENIGYITRVKCSFDDMMNALTGTVYINYTGRDTISFAEDNTYYMMTFKNVKIRKFWIRKTDYIVEKYIYLTRRNTQLSSFEFSDFKTVGNGTYAQKIILTKGTVRVSYRITSASFNQNNLSFDVDIPNDVRRVKW